jgi:hypothetical protein
VPITTKMPPNAEEKKPLGCSWFDISASFWLQRGRYLKRDAVAKSAYTGCVSLAALK